ncbi:hypothetical protein EGW08_007820 [Elysia chlorotica]|uniref:Uncharacterized protein n=1 Tax=Elysia chlorotica TaxID=188477 RepID=A0A3S1C6P1_ELYCH|nr:hypothetical protein EGW08_007820 [Elysia chlorotica]
MAPPSVAGSRRSSPTGPNPKLTTEAFPTNQRELWKLSFSDTRRIAAVKSRLRLREALHTQDALLRKGGGKLSDWQVTGVVSYQHVLALHSIWDHVVKLVDVTGIQLLAYLRKHCRSVQAVLSRMQAARCHVRPNFGSREQAARMRRAGRVLVFQITELLANVRYRDTMRALVGQKLDMLLDMGFRPDDVQDMAVKVVHYLQHHHTGHWNRSVEHACSVFLKALRSLGNEHLAPTEQFQEPIAAIHGARVSF